MNIKKIPFSKVDCKGNEKRYINQVLESGWLTTASKTKEFEEKFLSIIGAKYACAVSSCTAALHLVMEAMGVRPGDKVIVPSMNFTAGAEVVRYLGADPTFIDVDYDTCQISSKILKNALDRYPDTKVLNLVHFGGHPAPLFSENEEGIYNICRKRGIRLIEDAAHAFPAKLKGKMVGSIGDATCFSFYANKTITTGEGGMITTNSNKIFHRVNRMRLHGIDRDVWNRYTSNRSHWEYDIIAPGYKYNMPDTAAAIGLAQLERAFEFRKKREKCARFYYDYLKDIECIDLPELKVKFKEHAWHLFWIILKDDALVSRNRFIELMSQKGVGTSVHYKPLHRMTYYRHRYNLKPENFPNTEKIWKGNVSLPIYSKLTDDELEYICDTIRKILHS